MSEAVWVVMGETETGEFGDHKLTWTVAHFLIEYHAEGFAKECEEIAESLPSFSSSHPLDKCFKKNSGKTSYYWVLVEPGPGYNVRDELRVAAGFKPHPGRHFDS